MSPSRAQVAAGFGSARCHGGLGQPSVGSRIARGLAADIVVYLEHPVVVAKHVIGDSAAVSVLSISTDVHLHHAVADGLADLVQAGAGAPVEDEIERAPAPPPRADNLLDLAQHGRPQPDMAGLVDAVDVP